MPLLAGNHDQELIDFRWPGGPQAMNTVMLNRGGSAADTVLAHGHQFDPIETLPRDIQGIFRPWRHRESSAHTPEHAGGRQPALAAGAAQCTAPEATGRPKPVPPFRARSEPTHCRSARTPSTWFLTSRCRIRPRHSSDSFGGGGRKPTVDGPRQTFYTDIAWWAEQISKDGGTDVRVVVIGHTHQARIVRGTRPDGTPFVLMDCGAWVGTSFLSDDLDAPIANGQIGVKVGDDLRIYQLGYTVRGTT